MLGKLKKMSILPICLFGLTSCPCDCAVRANPYGFDSNSFDLFSDKECNDGIGTLSISLDEKGICFSYELNRKFDFVFDVSSIVLKSFDIFLYDHPDRYYSFNNVRIVDPDGNLTLIECADVEKLSPYAGVCSSSECSSSLQMNLSFNEGHNGIYMPLRTDEWSIFKNHLHIAVVSIDPESEVTYFTSKQIFLEPTYTNNIEFFKTGIMIYN